MPEDLSLILVDEMPGYFGILYIQLFIGTLDSVFVVLKKAVFFGVNKAGLKKELPEAIEVDPIAEVHIVVFCPIQSRQQFCVVGGVYVNKGQAAFQSLAVFTALQTFLINNLYLAGCLEVVGQVQFQLRYDHAGQEYGLLFLLYHRKSGTGDVFSFQRVLVSGKRVLENNIRRGD